MKTELSAVFQAVKLLYGFKTHSGRLTIYHGCFDVAKASFRKSLVVRVLPCLVPGSIVITVPPLLTFGLDKKRKPKILGQLARPVIVHNDSVTSPNLLEDTRRESYNHILSFLKMFISDIWGKTFGL